ncbi:MAG: hydrolase, haloacid dehalogenase-like family [Myxococcaceae bacterium]|nr:hydrolase, haloacid dehalogenase-like family [Myxococcaceae bacterium]
MKRPRGALLDLDGTLLDSNDAHALAWVAALAERDIHVRRDDVRPLIGMGGDKLLPAIANIDPESALGRAVSERRGELFREHYLASVDPFPGVRALLERMRADGLTLVVASSAKSDELGDLLDATGARSLFSAATTSDDVARSKPDPDIVTEAVRRAGLDADELVMLGDTPYDVEAARRAGVRIVAVRCGGWDDAGLRGAAAIYDGPADLLTRYESSIFAGR